MTTQAPQERWEVELKELRLEMSRLRDEQREMAAAIQELVTTFRSLATHLGIATEPYARKGAATHGSDRDIPGFG